MEKLYENNSILRSSSILYNSILKESSCIERLHLTQRQSEIRFNKSITQYLNSWLHNSINLKSSYLGIQKENATLDNQRGKKLKLTRSYEYQVFHITRFSGCRVTKEGHFPN